MGRLYFGSQRLRKIEERKGMTGEINFEENLGKGRKVKEDCISKRNRIKIGGTKRKRCQRAT